MFGSKVPNQNFYTNLFTNILLVLATRRIQDAACFGCLPVPGRSVLTDMNRVVI
jgi:hypothetical protein